MGPALGPVLGPAGPCNGMASPYRQLACVSGAPSPPSPAAGLTGLGQQRPPEGSAYLPCLCTSPWASRLCRCGRLHGNNGERESSDRRTWQAGEDVRRDRIPAALPSVRNGAYLFFFTLTKGRCQAGHGRGWGVEEMLRLAVGTGQKEGSHDFCKVGSLCFSLSGKVPGHAAPVPPVQLGLATPGAWTQELPWGLCHGGGTQLLHLQTRVSQVCS